MSESDSCCLQLSHEDSSSDDVGAVKTIRAGCGVLMQLKSLKDAKDS